MYDDVHHLILLLELETNDGKKDNRSDKLNKSLNLDAISDKDEYIKKLRKDHDELQNKMEKHQLEMQVMKEQYERALLSKQTLSNNMYEHLGTLLSKQTVSKVDYETSESRVKVQCSKCDAYLNGNLEMESHIRRDCAMSVEFNNVYKYNTETFGRSIYNNDDQIDTAGDIYIVETDFSLNEPHYKIGKTVDVRNRMVQYRTGCVREPRLHCYYPFSDVLKADNYLKKALQKYNLKREIYRGNLNEIKEVIRGYQWCMDGCIAEFAPKLSI